jgi:hypothetical protein
MTESFKTKYSKNRKALIDMKNNDNLISRKKYEKKTKEKRLKNQI